MMETNDLLKEIELLKEGMRTLHRQLKEVKEIKTEKKHCILDEKYQSDEIDKIALALSKVQGKLTVLGKDAKAQFAFTSYKAMVISARKHLAENELAFSCRTATINASGYPEFIVTTLMHSSGQWLRSIIKINVAEYAANIRNKRQAYGSECTYIERYAYKAMLGIVCDKDAEDDDGSSLHESTSLEDKK